jgi:hypothetical protein
VFFQGILVCSQSGNHPYVWEKWWSSRGRFSQIWL